MTALGTPRSLTGRQFRTVTSFYHSDDEILKRQKEAIEQEKERLHAEARGQLAERYWHIKANADKGIYHDPVKAREPKIFSLPTGAP